ncbi:MAG: AMP-dependent synthetase/ligase [Spirochaetaceae bacterium]
METALPRLFRSFVTEQPDAAAQYYKESSGAFQKRSYKELLADVNAFASALHELGVGKGSHLGLISENCREWLIADLAILSIGAADVPRGLDATDDELSYILKTAECRVVLVENEGHAKRVAGLKEELPKMELLIVMRPDSEEYATAVDAPKGVKVRSLHEMMEAGRELYEKNPEPVETAVRQAEWDDLATIIFTSGTTGTPKGVMLSHGNFLHQVKGVPSLIDVGRGDIWLCVLPVWHSFERIMQYVAIGTGCSLAYSKPIGKIMLEDFKAIRPTWMASVPRIWEALKSGIYRNINKEGGIKKALFLFFVSVGGGYSWGYNRVKGLLPDYHGRIRWLDKAIGVLPLVLLFPLKKLGDLLVFGKIRARLGGRFVAGISGGGALPKEVDTFFQAAGILLLEGYGLTETGPVLGVRERYHPVPGTVGPIFPGTEVQVRDEAGTVLPPGEKGVLFARGPQVMLGYYKEPEKTRAILDEEGWINTGDIGMLTRNDEITILGRAKDTVVLRGGENVEPLPIEQKLRESEYIEHAVVVGQDQKFLAALLVPNWEALEAWAEGESILFTDRRELVGDERVRALYDHLIDEQVSAKTGFKSFERVYRFALLPEEFTQGEELSAKQEVKRHVIQEKYKKEIAALFD